MAGSKRSSRAASASRKANASSSTQNDKISSKTKKRAVAERRGDNDDDEDHVKQSSSHTANNNIKSPPEDERKILSAAPLDKVDNDTPAEENNDNKDPPPKKTNTDQDDPPPPAPPQPQLPPAKIKGRFTEVKMKQLTTYFSTKTTTSSASGGDGNGTKTSASLGNTSRDDGGEEDTNTTTKSSAGKKRPLTDAGEAEADDDDNNLKKRKAVNDEDGGNNTDDHRGTNLDESSGNTKSDQDKMADTTQDPDAPNRPIGSTDDNDVGQSAITLDSNTITATATDASCPLHFLANAIIMSPDAKKNAISSERGNIDVKDESAPMPKIISNLNDDDDKCEAKQDDGDINDEPAAGKVDTSIGESTDGEAGESAANGKCPDITPTTDEEEGDSERTANVEAEVQAQQVLNEERASCPKDDSLPQKIEEGESSTTLALDNVEMEKSTQSSDTKTSETTLNEGEATAMDVDETTETTIKGQTPQHVEDSTNSVVTDDAPLPQVSVAAAETTSHPELSTPSNNFAKSNITKKAPTPSVSQLKMALFLEASRVHAGSKPERIFANYWDALEKYIAPCRNNRTNFTTRSDPSFKFNATLELFLKTRKMKRLHNKLILALISESVKDHVPVHSSSDFIPRVWRNRTRHLHRMSEDDVELDELGSSDVGSSLHDDWKSSFGNSADVWSPRGNSMTIVPRIDQHEFVAKKREEREEEEVSNEEIIPSCRLPGVVTTDLFVRKVAGEAGLTVSHDSMWLLIVAAREYASSIIGRAIDNDKNMTNGQISRIPKSDYSSLSCEHLLADKKSGKKKDSKKKESANKAERSKGVEHNESDENKKEKKVLNCSDISQVLYEQNAAAPRLAWMRSMGRGVSHYKPDLQTTNDIINTSIQRAAIKRRRNVDPVTAVEESLHDKSQGKSAVVNEGLVRGGVEESEHKVDTATEKRPSISMNDYATKDPPKSSDLLKSHVPTTEPTTESSAAPTQSALSSTVDSTTTTPKAPPGNVSQIRQVSKFGAKNLAAMRARRGSVVKEAESGAGKEETSERLERHQSQAAEPVTQSLPQQPLPVSGPTTATSLPAPAPASTNQNKVELPERLAPHHQAAGPVTQTPLQQPASAPTAVTNLPAPSPASANQSKEETETMAIKQQSAGPVPQSLQQPTPASTSITNQIVGLEERERLIKSQYQQQQHKPEVKSNTSQLWKETAMTMQSQVEQDGDEDEALLHSKMPRRTSSQLWQETEMTMQSQVEQDGNEKEALQQPNLARRASSEVQGQ